MPYRTSSKAGCGAAGPMVPTYDNTPPNVSTPPNASTRPNDSIVSTPSTPSTPRPILKPLDLGLNLMPRRGLKRSYAYLDLNEMPLAIPVLKPSKRRATDSEILMKLDDQVQPGLYEEEFRALFERMAKCSCGMIMSQRVFGEHRCDRGMFRPLKKQKTEHISAEVIDLTIDT